MSASATETGTPSATRSAQRFPGLDTLRAFAVSLVVLTHSAFATGRYVRGTGNSVLAHCDIGVPIFFVISGFLLSREWFVAYATGRPAPRVRAYFWRRALRILPLYWVTVAIALLLVPQSHKVTYGDWLRHAFLVQVYDLAWLKQGLTQTWSLCTEAAFYVVLPVLALAIVALARRGVGIAPAALGAAAVLLAGDIGWTYWYRTTSLGGLTTTQWWLPSVISWFGVGIALAGVSARLAEPRPAGRWGRWAEIGARPGLCWTAAVALFMIVVTPLGTSPTLLVTTQEAVVRNVLYALIAGLVVLPAVIGHEARTHTVAGLRVSRFLGDTSYGVFLLHLSILNAVPGMWGYRAFAGNTLPVWATTMALTLPAAALAFRLIERPAMRLRRLVPLVSGPAQSQSHGSAAQGPDTSDRDRNQAQHLLARMVRNVVRRTRRPTGEHNTGDDVGRDRDDAGQLTT